MHVIIKSHNFPLTRRRQERRYSSKPVKDEEIHFTRRTPTPQKPSMERRGRSQQLEPEKRNRISLDISRFVCLWLCTGFRPGAAISTSRSTVYYWKYSWDLETAERWNRNDYWIYLDLLDVMVIRRWNIVRITISCTGNRDLANAHRTLEGTAGSKRPSFRFRTGLKRQPPVILTKGITFALMTMDTGFYIWGTTYIQIGFLIVHSGTVQTAWHICFLNPWTDECNVAGRRQRVFECLVALMEWISLFWRD